MEEKKKKKSSLDSDDDESSSDRSLQRDVSTTTGNPTPPAASYYSSHITSVCQAMNSEAEKRMSPFEQLMLDKRRETNRLSARRCRKRRREEIQLLDEERRRLEAESMELTEEKFRLQSEYQSAISNPSPAPNTQAISAQIPFAAAPPRVEQDSLLLQLLHMQQRQAQQGWATPESVVAAAADPRLLYPSLTTSSIGLGLDSLRVQAYLQHLTHQPLQGLNLSQTIQPLGTDISHLAQSRGNDLFQLAQLQGLNFSAASLPRQSAIPEAHQSTGQQNTLAMMSLLSQLQSNTPPAATLLGNESGNQMFQPIAPFADASTDASRLAAAILDSRLVGQSSVTSSTAQRMEDLAASVPRRNEEPKRNPHDE